MTPSAAVLVDTSVWADHFRTGDAGLSALLAQGAVRLHPFVIGELAMGNLRDRARTIGLLQAMPRVASVGDEAWRAFVAQEGVAGSGLGFVDAHLLAAARTAGVGLWTRDRRLAEQAERLGCGWDG